MRRKLYLTEILLFIILISPLIYLAWLYPAMPMFAHYHLGLVNKLNSFDTKSISLVARYTLSVTNILWVTFYMILPIFFERLSTNATYKSVSKKSTPFVACFIIIPAYFYTIFQNTQLIYIKTLFFLIGFVLAFVGYLMINNKARLFISICTSWTLKSEITFFKTNKLSGEIWLIAGWIIFILAFFSLSIIVMYILISTILLIFLIPILYSYFYYKHLQKINPEQNEI